MVYAGQGRTLVLALGLCACTADDGGPSGAATTGSTGSDAGDVTATTLPLPTITNGSSSDGADSTAGSTEGSSEGTTAAGSSTGDPPTTGTSTGEPPTTSDTETGVVYDIEWCRLQFPPMADVAVDEVFTVYVRFYSPGLTDQSSGNDLAPELMVEMGYGLDGSDPSMGVGEPWTWSPGMPNPGWDGAMAGEPDNDEHWGDLSIGTAGVYDYASRISGDGGQTWVYCDLDDLLTGGYTPDQAGHAEVGQ
ncbi:MAG: hypothetical protein K0V04_38840 [Deltaproteobacteria bacterium]|nr:hypothetical protein [Deltaproteobacteria bacterium]